MEMYCGRANTTIAMRAFNVSPEETLPQMEEGMALLRKAMREDVFEESITRCRPGRSCRTVAKTVSRPRRCRHQRTAMLGPARKASR
jgi:hypothetical protein